MRKQVLALLALGLPALMASMTAHGNDCQFKADRAGGVDAKGVEKVVIRAGAGDMKVVGRTNATRIEARGVACAGKQALLDVAQISVRREGNTVYVETTLPQDDNNWSWGDSNYAYIDLGVALPASLPVDAIDSSGDAVFEDLKALVLQDSSGDLRVRRIAELADVGDSSGDLEIEDVGSTQVRDSSGDIEIDHVRSNVRIVSDSSGDMRIVNVGGNVVVESDSSGGIRIEDVKGAAEVDSDSSGDIYAARVAGDFTVSQDGSGSITHEAIGGHVTVPSNKE
jgi:hypothetical protein